MAFEVADLLVDLLAPSASGERTVEVEDACIRCTDRIRIAYQNQRLTKTSDAEPLVFMGKG